MRKSITCLLYIYSMQSSERPQFMLLLCVLVWETSMDAVVILEKK